MKLIGSTTSPYVRKVRVYLAETGISHRFVPVDAWQPTAELLAMAPVGKVPVLDRDDGTVLFESALVIEYLESLLPPHHRLVPAAGEARWTTLRWCALAHGMIDATATRVLELRRPEPLQMKERLAHEEARSARIIVAAERGLEGRDYFAGNKLTLADLTLATAMQYIDFRYSHEWRSGAPRLAGWCCTLHDRPSFVSTQPPGFVRPA